MTSPSSPAIPSGDPPGDLDVVHLGVHFAVVEKPAGLRSVPGRGDDAVDSVETRVRAAWPEATGPIAVHRLDVETSGLLVVALDPAVHRNLSIQFMKRKVGKRYIALLDGAVEGERGAVDLRQMVDWPNRPRQVICDRGGKRARTLWRVQDRTNGATRVEFRPETGRTHQLRLHAATPRSDGGIGCPILGDTLYGDPASAPRLMLHAEMLAFWNPDGSGWLKFERPAPF